MHISTYFKKVHISTKITSNWAQIFVTRKTKKQHKTFSLGRKRFSWWSSTWGWQNVISIFKDKACQNVILMTNDFLKLKKLQTRVSGY